MEERTKFAIGSWLIIAWVFAAILILAVSMAGCNEEICQPTAWMLGGTDVDAVDNGIVGRAGIRNRDNIEFGAESTWLGVHGESQIFGAYALYELPPDPNSGIVPYAGYHASIEPKDSSFFGPIGGTFIKLGENMDSVIEYQYIDSQGELSRIRTDEHLIYGGLRLRF